MDGGVEDREEGAEKEKEWKVQRLNAPSKEDMALSKGSADGSGGEPKMKESAPSKKEGTGRGDHILSLEDQLKKDGDHEQSN